MTTEINTQKAIEIADAILRVRQTQQPETVSTDVWKYIEEHRLMHVSYWPSKVFQITAKGNKFIQQHMM